MEEKSAGELQEHMLWTYYGLRVGLVAIAFALPWLVVVAGCVHGEPGFRGSLSDYYNVAPARFLTARDVFVGGLLAAAACLYLYKGYSNKENIALNAAGVFALLVAWFPTGPEGAVTWLHRTSAVLLFFCIGYVCLRRSGDTLDLLPEPNRLRYARRYKVIGWSLIASPLAAMAASMLISEGDGKGPVVLLIEAFGVWVFAIYWAVKTAEMRESEAEKRALDANLKRITLPEVAPAAAPSSKARAAQPREKVVPAA